MRTSDGIDVWTTHFYPYVQMHVLLALLAAITTSVAGAPPWMPVAREGVIEGKAALTVMAGDEGPDGEIVLQEPTGCEIRVVPEADRDREFTWKCGQWFQPPAAGKYLLWIESDRGISTHQVLLRYSPVPFRGRGSLTAHSLQPSGRVAVTSTVGGGDSFRFISLNPGQSVRTFERRVPASVSEAVVRMPAGRVVAGVFDAEGNALALSRPLVVEQGQILRAAVTRPPDADLLTIFTGVPERCADPRLELGVDARRPNEVVRSHERAPRSGTG